MPELPEVETMRRGIAQIVGTSIVNVHVARSRFKPIRVTPASSTFNRLAGNQRIVAVDRMGKRVVVILSNDYRIVFEPRMTGLVLLADPPDTAHLRVQISLAGQGPDRLLYWDRRGLGSVRLFTPRQLQRELGPSKLGPDALSVSRVQLRDQLGASRQPIKVALLDQKKLAGVGNLYASEMLHVARIHPERQCDALRAKAWQRLHAALRSVLLEAIRYEGSTLSDGTYRNALNQYGLYQNCHRVYDRAGEKCPTCKRGRIRRIVQAQRSTFFCAICQRSRPDSR